MGLQFFPRGGSAHVAWNLARQLPAAGWEPTVLTGSVGLPGRLGNAQTFYEGVRVRELDMTAALSAPDPMRADPPLHPSYEDRPGAPDRVFCSLPDEVFEHHAASWAAALAGAGAASADVLHLHHLTPLNEAAARVAPGVPVVGHLHGTELLMLEAAVEDPGHWPHSAAWVERLRRWATACERLLVLSATQAQRAEALLGIDPGRCVHIPNGVDPQTFVPRHVERAPFWRRQLVEAPQGWAPGGEPGSVAYTDADMAPFERGAPVLLYVGRFTKVKRLPLLIEAHARARDALRGTGPARPRGRLPRRVGGRTPAHDDPPHRRPRRLSGRLARPPRAALAAGRRRRGRAAPASASSSAKC